MLLWFLLSLFLGAGVHSSQPDTWSVYPPDISGKFTVPVDNFQYDSVDSFDLRYLGFDGFTEERKGRSIVLLYLGNEGQIESFYNASGFLFELASELSASVLFIEVRVCEEHVRSNVKQALFPFLTSFFSIDTMVNLCRLGRTVLLRTRGYGICQLSKRWRTTLCSLPKGCLICLDAKTVTLLSSAGAMAAC